jgi:hypothetical protein
LYSIAKVPGNARQGRRKAIFNMPVSALAG